MNKPEISIIVPVYNVENYMKECIESILAQSFTDIEVLLINDGSTDRSGEICDEFAQKDERVRVIHKPYGGVSSARNAGIRNAKGNYIGFVDGDDRVIPTTYEELYYLCQQTESEIAICTLGREVDGQLINRKPSEKVLEMTTEEALKQMLKGVLYRFSLCNKLFHRSCFQHIQFPEGRIHEDLSTTYRVMANAKRIVFKDFIGYIYVKRSNSILTSTYSQKRLDAFLGWDEMINFINNNFPFLIHEAVACFTYNLIDHIFYILHQVKDANERDKYLKVIQGYVRKHFKLIRENNFLNFSYKLMMMSIFVHIKFLVMLTKLKRGA
jgi:glycosyltransferase involved in cell wall biosynthesis